MQQLFLSGVTRPFACEYPVPEPEVAEVFLFHPSLAFIGMSSDSPSPQRLEDHVVYGSKSLFAAHMLMIVRPSPYHGVELPNQVASRGCFVTLDDFPNFG
jgi:hypothetical protein